MALKHQQLLLEEEEEAKKLQLEKKNRKKNVSKSSSILTSRPQVKKEKVTISNESQPKKPSSSLNKPSKNEEITSLKSNSHTNKRKKKRGHALEEISKSTNPQSDTSIHPKISPSFVDTFSLETSDEDENEFIRNTLDSIDHNFKPGANSNRGSDGVSKIGLLRIQLEAAQQSIVTLEKELQREKQKNSDLQSNLQFTQQEVAQMITGFTEKLTTTEKKLEDLQTKYHQERLKNLCVLCMQNEREVILFPCSHFLLCLECSSTLPNSKCNSCNLSISGVLHLKKK